LLASSVLELSLGAPLNAFLGSAPHHPAGTSYSAPAMRVIVFTDVCGSVAQTHQLGDEGHMQLLREHDEIVRSQLLVQEGREVKHTGDGIMAHSRSVVSAITFAVQVQRRLHERNENAETPFHISIGISAGGQSQTTMMICSVRPSSWQALLCCFGSFFFFVFFCSFFFFDFVLILFSFFVSF